jgi:hypothetical protein
MNKIPQTGGVHPDKKFTKDMKLKLCLFAGAALLTVASQSVAGDIFRINNYNTLITASHGDLVTFMALNARHLKQAMRSLYNQLQSRGALFDIQPGTRIEVVEYYNDGTARIEWGDGRYTGYINKDDLSVYLGSND